MTDYSYKDRVRREYQELKAGANRLRTFNRGVVYESLPKEEQARLEDQLYHMIQYEHILSRRIAWFDKQDCPKEGPCDDDPCGR